MYDIYMIARRCHTTCNWLYLRRLVPWMNHLPPVFFKWQLVCYFGTMVRIFLSFVVLVFLYITHSLPVFFSLSIFYSEINCFLCQLLCTTINSIDVVSTLSYWMSLKIVQRYILYTNHHTSAPNSFSHRVVNDWNTLSKKVVECTTINPFNKSTFGTCSTPWPA